MRNCSKFNNWVLQHWQQPKLIGWLLWPFTIPFRAVSNVRKFAYMLFAYRAKVPIVIVGNISVGGTGKTPTVIYLAQLLQKQGYRPAIVTRGYKGKYRHPMVVAADADPVQVGDEALLMAQQCSCPVVVARQRVAGVKMLQDQVDVIICDDGLQHYKLGRDIEIALIDGNKKFGNGFMLPMGPLREPAGRLCSVDFILENGIDLQLVPEQQLRGDNVTIHAVAGIGSPERFFTMLRSAGFNIIEHAFPDHYAFTAKDLQFADPYPIYMTEKDAVKCKKFAANINVVKVRAEISPKFVEGFLALLKEKQNARSKSVGDPCVSNLQG